MATPLSPETIVYGFTSAGDANVSPDGARIVYTLARTDREKKKGGSQLWMCDIDGENTRRLTYNGEANRMARWSPDGTQIAFVSDRKSPNGLFVMPTGGGEAREVVHAATTIVDLTWSADSRRIAFVRPLDPENPSGDKPAEGAAPKVRVTSRIDYKQDNRGYLGDARHQVFVVDVEQRRCSPGDDGGVRSHVSAVVAGREGTRRRASQPTTACARGWRSFRSMAARRRSSARRRAPWARGRGRPTARGSSTRGTRTSRGRPTSSCTTWRSGETRRVTTDLQQLPAAGFPTVEPPSMPVWLDERHVLFHGYQRGASGLFVIDLASGNVEQVDGGQSLRSGLSTDAGAAVRRAGFREPGGGRRDHGVRSRNRATRRSSPATTTRSSRRRRRRNGSASTSSATATSSRRGCSSPPISTPKSATRSSLDIHGGPNGFYGYAFNAIQQVLATQRLRGGLLQPARIELLRPRVHAAGDATTGAARTTSTSMAVVDEALKRPYCDPSRTGIWGYSYGGYMTAWTIGQTHRFKAAVCGAPCFDLESMYGTSDISHEFGPLQWGGAPHEAQRVVRGALALDISRTAPRTPTLIIQGEADDRCPIGQGEADVRGAQAGRLRGGVRALPGRFAPVHARRATGAPRGRACARAGVVPGASLNREQGTGNRGLDVRT